MTVVWSYARQRQGLCDSLVSDYFRDTALSDPTPLSEQMAGFRSYPSKAVRKGIPAWSRTPPAMEQAILEKAKAGINQRQIAADVGVSKSCVFRVLKRLRADHRKRLREKAA